ncbi:MAG: D-inositol-3-phosphate glycosyltransferase [Acidimicrobiaceae bacterium]
MTPGRDHLASRAARLSRARAQRTIVGARQRLARALAVVSPPEADPEPAPPPTGDLTIGYLDVPSPNGPVTTIDDGLLWCSGWVLFGGCVAGRAEVFVNDVPIGAARVGLARPDLPHVGIDAPIAGFELVTSLDGSEIGYGTKRVTVIATSLDGETRQKLGPAVVNLQPPPPLVVRPRPLLRIAATGPHVVAFTPQLGFGGGQLYLQDLLHGLTMRGDIDLTLVSHGDGPLREELEAMGIAVRVTAPRPLRDPSMFESRIDELEAWLRSRPVDVVIVNGMDSFAGAVAAAQAGIPFLWAIHESYSLPAYWVAAHGIGGIDPEVRRRAEQALGAASALIFEATATRDMYAPHAPPGRAIVVPYGIDLDALDASAQRWSRDEARRALGIRSDDIVLLCMGTIEPRKCQTLLIRAFREIAERHPRASLALVGDIGGQYADAVRSSAAASGLGERIRIELVQPDPIPWYRAADVLVSASDVESMPRSAIQAMALGTPVLATDIYGLPELIDDGVTGYLFAPRDVGALVAGMERFLALTDEDRSTVAEAAAAHARRSCSTAGYVGAYHRFITTLAADPAASVVP